MASMTKEELKNALISHGAPVPPSSAKKEEFVQAFETHVAPLEGGEFSSDDEATTPKKKAGRPKISSSSKLSSSSKKSSSSSPKKTAKSDLEDSIEMTVDIGSLDDDQLREMMVKNGLEVGPIVASTRKFYERRLGLVLSGTPSNGHAKEYSDTEPEEDEEEQPAVQVVVKASPKKRSSRSSKSLLSSPLSESGMRQRLVLGDSVDSSPSSPGARRSIHSYKVTESTSQVTRRGQDGTETVDTKHSVERTESGGEKPASQKSLLSGILYPAIKLAILLILLLGLYVVFTTPSDGVTPIDKVADIINSALPPPPEPAQEAAVPAPAVPAAAPSPPPPAKPLPDQAAVADV